MTEPMNYVCMVDGKRLDATDRLRALRAEEELAALEAMPPKQHVVDPRLEATIDRANARQQVDGAHSNDQG